MKRVLILGGGFGGVPTALSLRQQLAPEDEIVVVDRQGHFMVGFRKTWALLDQSPLADGMRPLEALKARGITVMQSSVTAIDPAGKAAEIDGKRMEADALVVALGARLAPEQIPGFSGRALNVYDRDNIEAAAGKLRAFRGGKVALGIFGEAFKCPPAPFEIALTLKDYFIDRGVPAEIDVFSPLPLTIPALGAEGCSILDTRLADAGINFHPLKTATAVEDGAVVFSDGQRLEFDLLLGIPPHRVTGVVADSGLLDGKPWVPVDVRTLQTLYEDVYAIGDNALVKLANGKRLPMAGLFAQKEGEVVASRIAAGFKGVSSEALFDGMGACFLEVGGGQAVMIQGNFLAESGPQVEMTPASAELYQNKLAFESERLDSWFGTE